MLVQKTDLPLVAMEFMNEVHLEEIEMLNVLNDKLIAYEVEPSPEGKEDVCNYCEKWYQHTISHFNGEEVEMQRTHFPPYIIHKNEHDNFLAVMRAEINSFNQNANPIALQKFIALDVVPWLIQHIRTMDTVTAMFLKNGISPCCGNH